MDFAFFSLSIVILTIPQFRLFDLDSYILNAKKIIEMVSLLLCPLKSDG